jgi:hypothetical protein
MKYLDTSRMQVLICILKCIQFFYDAVRRKSIAFEDQAIVQG